MGECRWFLKWEDGVWCATAGQVNLAGWRALAMA